MWDRGHVNKMGVAVLRALILSIDLTAMHP